MTRFLKILPGVLAFALSLALPSTTAKAADKKIVLPRSIVQVAEIPLLYRDDGAMKHRHRGRLLYWDENNVRIFARLEDVYDMAHKSDSRCPFDDDNIRLTLELTLEHIPSAGRDVDLIRYYDTFIVGTLTNDERMKLTLKLEKTMEAWQRNLQDVIRVLGVAGAMQAMECNALLGQVAAQDIETAKFYDRLYWRQETMANGKVMKYFFVANEFFREEDK